MTYGHDTHRWPWHVGVYHQLNETNRIYRCGGTLVSSYHILTAAHCVLVTEKRLFVSLGQLHLNESNDGTFMKVAKIMTHPDFKRENFENDIAIVTLSREAIFDNYVQPICMWMAEKTELSEVIGKFGTVVGWGLTEKREIPSRLQEVALPVVPHLTCLESYRDLFGRFLTNNNFCAGTRNGTSVCTGDSGGSMTFQENGKFYIRGIVSVGANKINQSTETWSCDSMQYALFTDVAQYLPWIRNSIDLIRCEKVVKCSPIYYPACILVLSQEHIERRCKIIFEESSSGDVKELYVHGAGSTAVLHLSSAANQFINLEKLSLANFNLGIVRRASLAVSLSSFRQISKLALDYCGISQIGRGTFNDLKNVKELSLAGNKLSILHVDTFKELGKLEVLDMHHNTIVTLPAEIFRNNPKIRELNLYDNVLSELHRDVFEHLRSLEKLVMNANEFEVLPSNIFRNNGKMRILHLDSNRLNDLSADIFTELSNLEELDLSDNRIWSIRPELFRSNAKLGVINLSFNEIQKIEIDLTSMTQLKALNLAGNRCIDMTFEIRDLQWSLSAANDIIRRNCTKSKSE